METMEIRKLIIEERNAKTIKELSNDSLLKLHEMAKKGLNTKFTSKSYYEEFNRRGLSW